MPGCQQRQVEISLKTGEEEDEKGWVHNSSNVRYRFSKKNRLGSKKAIDQLFKKGKYKSSGFLNFRYLGQNKGHTRIVISISKRVGTAPERNRLKRIIREALRFSGFLDDTSLDCAVFVTKPPKRTPTLIEVQKYLKRFISHLPDEFKETPE